MFPDAKHVQAEGLTAELNNNQSERLQGTFRQRTKTLRGLDTRASGQTYLDGWTLDYNLFRKHHSLGNKTPAEAARVSVPYDEWEDVVESAAPHRRARVEVVVVDTKRDNADADVSVKDDSLDDLPASGAHPLQVQASAQGKRTGFQEPCAKGASCECCPSLPEP